MMSEEMEHDGCMVTGAEDELVITTLKGVEFRQRGLSNEEASIALTLARRDNPLERGDQSLGPGTLSAYQRYRVLFSLGGCDMEEPTPEQIAERKIGMEGWSRPDPVTYKKVCRIKETPFEELLKNEIALSGIKPAEAKN